MNWHVYSDKFVTIVHVQLANCEAETLADTCDSSGTFMIYLVYNEVSNNPPKPSSKHIDYTLCHKYPSTGNAHRRSFKYISPWHMKKFTKYGYFCRCMHRKNFMYHSTVKQWIVDFQRDYVDWFVALDFLVTSEGSNPVRISESLW